MLSIKHKKWLSVFHEPWSKGLEEVHVVCSQNLGAWCWARHSIEAVVWIQACTTPPNPLVLSEQKLAYGPSIFDLCPQSHSLAMSGTFFQMRTKACVKKCLIPLSCEVPHVDRGSRVEALVVVGLSTILLCLLTICFWTRCFTSLNLSVINIKMRLILTTF